MPKRSEIEKMPEDVRSWLEGAIAENNFGEYRLLKTLLAEKGIDLSHVSIHKHGKKMEERMKKVRLASDMAKTLVNVVGDDAGNLNDATTSLLQTNIFETLVAYDDSSDGDDPKEKLMILNKAAVGVAQLARASVNQKQFAVQVKKDAAKLAQDMEKTLVQQGMDETQAAIWREKILMIGG